jgi:hypothetical protein
MEAEAGALRAELDALAARTEAKVEKFEASARASIQKAADKVCALRLAA